MYSNSFQISFYAPSLNILFIKMANKKSAKGPLGTFISLTTGVNLYTFGVALGPPPNAEFGPPNGALGPPNVFQICELQQCLCSYDVRYPCFPWLRGSK